jgi:hypothetical protein
MTSITVKVVEALCGCGKSYWAIEHMRANPNEKWCYVTPFLDEAGDEHRIGRLREQAPEMGFQVPSTNGGNNTKLQDLERLLEEGENVSVTHNLFLNINEHVLQHIRKHNYCIVIDETLEKVSLHEKSSEVVDDIKFLIDEGFIVLGDNGKLEWVKRKLNTFADEYELCKRGMLYLFMDKLLVRSHTSKVYDNAKEVFVLTYMFASSTMRVWFDAQGIKWEYYNGANMRISTAERKKQIRSLITIEKDEDDLIGHHTPLQTEYSLKWFRKNGAAQTDVMRGVSNRLYRRWQKRDKRVPKIMFTTFKEYADMVAGIGTRREDYSDPDASFVAKNARATNNHADRTHLIYWVNVYPHTLVKRYLQQFVGRENGADNDSYAVSEMVQWVFRSALREGKPISIFIASKRMRELFTAWLESDD